MITAEYREYLLSEDWGRIKNILFRQRGKKCEKCSDTKYLQVHHKTYKNIYNERLSDLQILCMTCHKKAHGLKVKSKKQKSGIAQVKQIEPTKPKNSRTITPKEYRLQKMAMIKSKM